jgi:polysaccharide pyruvyl transferase WcaK-like protein
MLQVLKRLIPTAAKSQLRELQSRIQLKGVFQRWKKLKLEIRHQRNCANPRAILIFPADTGTISGSLGDEAMITSIIQHYQSIGTSVKFKMLCTSVRASEELSKKGFEPVLLPSLKDICSNIADILRDSQCDRLIVVGADVMDGYYDRFHAAAALVTADVAARMGLDSVVIGCSFNASPIPGLKPFFDDLDENVKVNLRDKTSLDRFNAFSTHPATLVADAAFMMKAAPVPPELPDWVDAQRALDRHVIGINIHPLLFKNATPIQIQSLIDSMSTALAGISKRSKVAWLMLPHDYRDDGGAADGICLRPLHAKLVSAAPEQVFYLEGVHHASVLKGVAGLLDGVVTARMHLAIAALGMGVPTLCFTYQDKFEGLFRHFDMPHDLLLAPKIFEDLNSLQISIEKFIEILPDLKRQVEGKLPTVMELSRRNLA